MVTPMVEPDNLFATPEGLKRGGNLMGRILMQWQLFAGENLQFLPKDKDREAPAMNCRLLQLPADEQINLATLLFYPPFPNLYYRNGK
jgi:hypothetical protein